MLLTLVLVTVVGGVLAAIGASVARERQNATRAAGLVDALLNAETPQVSALIRDLAPYRRWANPLLREERLKAEKDSSKQLHASLALVPVDVEQVDYLFDRMLHGSPQEVVAIRGALLSHKRELTERLWIVQSNPENDQGQRLRAACTLADFSPNDPRWKKASPDIAAMLATQKPFEIALWTSAFKGVGKWLIPSLAGFLVDEKRSVSERGLIATIYNSYASDAPDAYALLEKQLSETSQSGAAVEEKIALAKRQASIGVALLVMGRGGKGLAAAQAST